MKVEYSVSQATVVAAGRSCLAGWFCGTQDLRWAKLWVSVLPQQYGLHLQVLYSRQQDGASSWVPY